MSGIFSRPMSSTSSKLRVVISASFKPRRCTTALTPTVVPCVKYDTWAGSRPCRAFSCSMPARTSLPGASGREKTFRV